MKIDVDHSPLKSQIQKYMTNRNYFVAMQHANSTKITSKVQNERLAIVASQIADYYSKSAI